MNEARLDEQVNIRITKLDKRELENTAHSLDLAPAQVARVIFRRGLEVVREQGIKSRAPATGK